MIMRKKDYWQGSPEALPLSSTAACTAWLRRCDAIGMRLRESMEW